MSYALLLVMSLGWASLYLLVKVAEAAFPSIFLMALRALIASLCLLAVALVTRRGLSVPRGRHGHLFALSVLTISFIWVAIATAEETLSSGLTALLTALIPIGTFLLSMRTDKPKPRQLLGLLVALAGLVVVIGPSRLEGGGAGLWLMAASCLAYAFGGLLAARKAHDLHPVVTTTWTLLYATVTLFALAFLLERPLLLHPSVSADVSVLSLGALATALPSLIFFRLVQTAGAPFASLFGYLVPVLGVVLSILFLHEKPTAGLVPGILLLLAGLWLLRKE